jgi:hypothetical protein
LDREIPHGTYQSDGAAASWIKFKNPTYSQAEGRHALFEQRQLPRPRRKVSPPALVLA